MKKTTNADISLSDGYHLYTDGSTYPKNPGHGGWGYVILLKDKERIEKKQTASGAMPDPTTNNQAEMMACVSGLEFSKAHFYQKITVHTDSRYIVDCFNKQWYINWRKRNWMRSTGEGLVPVLNKEYWENLLLLSNTLQAKWEWVRGHSGNVFNEECDLLAKAASKESNYQ